jgi:hypothetical protein
LATNAEGAAMVAYENKETEDGLSEEVSATVQAKGYLNDNFQIQTKYQITLWRWEMMVQGTPGDMDWDLYLDSWDRQDQNAYHEYMMVMQADEAKGFSLERLELSGTTSNPRWYWWDDDATMSIAINDIQISRPDINLEDYADHNDDVVTDAEDDERVEDDADDAEDEAQVGAQGSTSTTNINVEIPAQPSSCSTATGTNAPLGLALGLGLIAMGRRRDD